MTKKNTKKRTKHIPQRTCVGCKKVGDKRSFIRLVKSAEGIEIDPTGKLPGRGIYLHKRRSCWDLAVKSEISRGLRTELTQRDLDKIKCFMETNVFELDEAESNVDERWDENSPNN